MFNFQFFILVLFEKAQMRRAAGISGGFSSARVPHGLAMVCAVKQDLSFEPRSGHPLPEHDGGPRDVDQHILALIVCGFGWHTRTFDLAPRNCPYQAWFAPLAG